MSGRVAAKNLFLPKENFAKRLKFAKDHIKWTSEHWNRVLFTDESKFELFGCKRAFSSEEWRMNVLPEIALSVP